MVDTVMRAEDWRAVYGAVERHLADGADAVLAVTGYVDDESPVYVNRHEGGLVRAVSDEPIEPPCVTGGVYGWSAAARAAAAQALARGVYRMRGFLKVLLEGEGGRGGRGARVAAVDVARIIDLHRPRELAT